MNTPPSSDETLFAAALERPAAERAAFLDQACAGDPARRARLASLLHAHAGAGDFLAAPADALATAAAVTTPLFPPGEKPGDIIGRYKLLQKIGEGGCGAVYLAEQEEPVRRRVALKVIKLGMDTQEVIARFEAERQALALMDHPNIARVFDGGATDAGRPFFVMELVRGLPITKYCDEQNLPTAARLALFAQVCHAVQHAHQKGIIHRDLKPSNILVTLHDGVPVPKVIDFGIAKATQGRLTDSTLFTAFEQFLGTPAYMSPEQAELSGLDIDTRSDIYSLGVLLYELLTGRTPFDPKSLVSAGLDEIRRIIREVEPPRPSTRLGTLNDLDRATIAKQRGILPGQLSVLLRGDLDWIVMRCLEKDRTRRYDTPTALAADIVRHLTHEPVNARPPSMAYLLQKLVRRHRLGVATAAAITLALVGGTIVATWQAVRATHAEQLASARLQAEQVARREAESQRALADEARTRALAAEALAATRLRDETAARQDAERQKTRAEQERNRAVAAEQTAHTQAARTRAIGDFLANDLLAQASPTRQPDRDLKLRTVLDRAAQRIEGRFQDQPQVEVALRQTLASTYRALGDYAVAYRNLDRALALARPQLGADHPGVLVLEHSRAIILRFLGKLGEAETLARQTWATQQRVLGTEHPDTLATLGDLAIACRRLGRHAEAEELSRTALAALKRVSGPTHPNTVATMTSLANALSQQSKYAEAQPLFAEVVDLHRRTDGPEHPETLGASFNLALNYYYRDQLPEAEKLYLETLAIQQRVLGPEHSDTLDTMANLGAVYNKQSRFSEAESLLRRTLELETRLRGVDHPATQFTRSHLATTFSRQNKLAEAEPLRAQTLEVRRRVLGPEHPDTLASANDLAWLFRQRGKLAEAEALFAETLENQKRRLPAAHASVVLTTNNLGVTYLDRGKFAEATALFEQLVEDFKRALGPEHVRTLNAMSDLAHAYRRAGRGSEAEALLIQTLAAQKRTLPPGRREILISCNNLYQTLQDAGNFAEAVAVCAQMAEENRRSLGPDHDATLMFVSNHALSLCRAGRPAEALALAEESLQRRRSKGELDASDTLHTFDILATALAASGRAAEAVARLEEACRLAEAKRGPAESLVLYLLRMRATAELAAGHAADAQATIERALQRRQQRPTVDSGEQAACLTVLGRALLRREEFTGAEPPLREALTLREQSPGDDWRRFEAQSLLGASLLGQKNYAAAEPLLLAGWAGLALRQGRVSFLDRAGLREALERVVTLYRVTGQSAKASEWGKQLTAWRAAETQRFSATASVPTQKPATP